METVVVDTTNNEGDKGENLNFALQTASEMPEIKMFKWRAYRIAVNASFNSGVWSLEYYDPMQW